MPDTPVLDPATSLSDIIHNRHSARAPYDPSRPLPEADLESILEAARWSPTAHNMQNYEFIVVDDPSTLTAIGQIHSGGSAEFVRENYAQLSFSEEELIRKGTGVLATMFPPSWRRPDPEPLPDGERGTLDATMGSCPAVVIVVYDPSRRAPASEGDFLGIMSLGCAMQSMWLTAHALGVGMQIMSVFSSQHVEEDLRKILSIPSYIDIAFACRLGYPSVEPGRYLRVRREIPHFIHHNAYAVGA